MASPEPFADRVDAGRQLTQVLGELADGDPLVLGIPRGGVVVAAEVARTLGVDLDVVVPRKLGAPGNRELGIGAVADGVRVVDEELARRTGASSAYLEAEVAEQQEEVRRRTKAYRVALPPLNVAGRVALIVDDGVATGATAIAAIRWCRSAGASRVVLGAPVASPQVMAVLRNEADDVVVVRTPRSFTAVGQWYRDFRQVDDATVVRLLTEAHEGKGTG